MSQRIPSIDPATAQGKQGELLAAVKGAMGVVPNITRVMAQQPAVLEAYLGFSKALGGGAFDARTREAIALAVAGANACGYCASAHSAISASLKVGKEEIARRLAGHSEDARTDAIVSFARTLVGKRGLPSDADLAAARGAGLSDADVIEVVGHVALNLFTNYINHVADTDIDFPVVSVAGLKAA